MREAAQVAQFRHQCDGSEQLHAAQPLERVDYRLHSPVGRQRGDLCLLDRPLAAVLAAPSSSYVRLTLRAGTVIHGS